MAAESESNTSVADSILEAKTGSSNVVENNIKSSINKKVIANTSVTKISDR